ncbi:MAG TPA: hypothetical protein VGA89_00835 [Patescibacteria group bacterium]|jgi:mevalonate kinase
MPSIISGSANGKIILSGEHAGVYGYPMIAGPISKMVTVSINNDQADHYDKLFLQLLDIFSKKFNLNLKELKKLNYQITSDLPRKSGLGSSAAYIGALFRALASYFSLTITKPEFFALLQKSEMIFHGNSSGVDAAIVTSGKFLVFQKKSASNPQQKTLFPLALKTLKHTPLYAVYSGSATESTKELVDLVASTTAISARKKTTLKSIGQITKKIQTSLENGIFPFQLIQKNQRLLEGLGVVSLTAQKIISKIESIGGVAKITGAGGVKTGSGYLLAAHLDGEILENFLQSQKWEFFSIF